MNATANSKTITNIKIEPGRTVKTNQDESKMFNPKLEKIAKSRWPAVILAARRTPKEIILARWLTVSIMTRKGASPIGAPAGVNTAKYSSLKFRMAWIVAPIIIVRDKPMVTEIWTVGEKVYGIKPSTFTNRIKENKEKTRVK